MSYPPTMATRKSDLLLIETVIRKSGAQLPMHHEISAALQALERIERGSYGTETHEAFAAVHSLSGLLERHVPQADRVEAKEHWATLARALSRLGTAEFAQLPPGPSEQG